MNTQELATRAGPPPEEQDQARRLAYCLLAAAGWAVGALALGAVFLRISLGTRINSDGANNSLEAWDLLHGHLLLHGWLIGDATFYFLELPLNAVTEALFGLGFFATHAASALTYLLVAVCAVALALTDSRGPARVFRCAVVVMVLAAPLLSMQTTWLVLEEPDHIGTAVFMLVSFLLIDRMPGRRFTAPLLCVILCAGQFSDLTVRYVAVPAVVAVCGYRAIAARRLRSPDAALAAAAVISVPLELLLRTVTVSLGAFWMASPRDQVVSVGQWPHHAVITWFNLRYLFGVIEMPDTKLGVLGADFGLVCLVAALAGLARVVWVWPRASRAEQALCLAILANIGTVLISPLAMLYDSHEIVAVLPCGAVLASQALVPARIRNWQAAVVAVVVAPLVTVLPLTVAASQPLYMSRDAPALAWMKAHGLTYGLSGYWDSSSSTLESGNGVRIRNVSLTKTHIYASGYEVKTSWYDSSLHDARFVVADSKYPPAVFERIFGRPATTYQVGPWTILVYRTNLLRLLLPSGLT